MLTADEFMAKVQATDDGCWLWLGTISTSGYGRVGRATYAHRTAHEMFKGPIPDGFHIDHLCRVRACVNPDHLEAVSQRENTLRGMSPTIVVRRTKLCLRAGHDLSNPENVYVYPSGKRQCRVCLLAHHRARRLRAAS